ncbi:MAG: hypothetical protein ACREFJ_15000 [Acetobacteraceae bacterium]
MPEIKITRFRFALVVVGAVAGGMVAAGTAFAVQGHMVNARADLHTAYHQLSVALADKGGHRVKAMNLVEEAIAEVNAGIAAGAR